MDIILPTHTPQQLEETFEAKYLYDHPLFSLMAEPTDLPWLLVIPKQALTDITYVEKLYGAIHQLIHTLQEAGFGPLFNLAKLGNQNPHLHIHIIFRTQEDEAWPNPVWCHKGLKPSKQMPLTFKEILKPYFQ